MMACFQWYRLVVFLIICMTVYMMGCHPDAPACPSVDATCVMEQAAPDVEPAMRDNMAHNSLPRNMLLPEVLKKAKAFLTAIATAALSDLDTISIDFSNDIDQDVQSLMKYIVSCALDRTQWASAQVMGGGATWGGELGLCSEWLGSSPSKSCLETVSSCVLARVNAHGKQVLISMRGQSSWLFPLQNQVPIETTYRDDGDHDGNPDAIQSFAPCGSSPPLPFGDSMRNCGWQGRFVGTCQPGDQVMLTGPSGTMLRVCYGIHGCDNAAASDPDRWYARPLAFHTSNNSVAFTCPSHPTNQASFAVMIASTDPTAVLPGTTEVQTISGAVYPSPEEDVFTFKEAAFFGNIFSPIPDSTELGSRMLAGDQYACYSDVWHDGIAHLADRLCAGPSSECFQNSPRPCLACQPGSESQLLCSSQSCEQQAYLNCSTQELGEDPNELPIITEWKNSVTVFLNHPCDLAANRDTCKNAYAYRDESEF